MIVLNVDEEIRGLQEECRCTGKLIKALSEVIDDRTYEVVVKKKAPVTNGESMTNPRKTLTAEEKEEIRKKVLAGESIAFSDESLPKNVSVDFKTNCPFGTFLCNRDGNDSQI